MALHVCCKVYASYYKATSVTSNIITECWPNNDSDEDDEDLYDSAQEEDFDGQHSESTLQRRGDGECNETNTEKTAVPEHERNDRDK